MGDGESRRRMPWDALLSTGDKRTEEAGADGLSAAPALCVVVLAVVVVVVDVCKLAFNGARTHTDRDSAGDAARSWNSHRAPTNADGRTRQLQRV